MTRSTPPINGEKQEAWHGGRLFLYSFTLHPIFYVTPRIVMRGAVARMELNNDRKTELDATGLLVSELEAAPHEFFGLPFPKEGREQYMPADKRFDGCRLRS